MQKVDAIRMEEAKEVEEVGMEGTETEIETTEEEVATFIMTIEEEDGVSIMIEVDMEIDQEGMIIAIKEEVTMIIVEVVTTTTTIEGGEVGISTEGKDNTTMEAVDMVQGVGMVVVVVVIQVVEGDAITLVAMQILGCAETGETQTGTEAHPPRNSESLQQVRFQMSYIRVHIHPVRGGGLISH